MFNEEVGNIRLIPSRGQKCLRHDGSVHYHQEPPNEPLGEFRILGRDDVGEHWENGRYYGVIRRHNVGFGIGGGPYVILSITSKDETARHDWRDFQGVKNQAVGEEWEAIELYPAESRLKDPSNRFYLWCAPKGVFTFGLPGERFVLGPEEAIAAQRPFPPHR